MRCVYLTLSLSVALALIIGCDDDAAEVRADAEGACSKPKPTCPARPCSPTPGDPICYNGTWQCEHDDPMLCRGCNGVTATTYACRAFQCPSGTCAASDQRCLDLLCPAERADAGRDAGAIEPTDAALDAPRDGFVD